MGFLVAVHRRKGVRGAAARNDLREVATHALSVPSGTSFRSLLRGTGDEGRLVGGGGATDRGDWCEVREGDGSYAGLLAGVVPGVGRGDQWGGQREDGIVAGPFGLEDGH